MWNRHKEMCAFGKISCSASSGMAESEKSVRHCFTQGCMSTKAEKRYCIASSRLSDSAKAYARQRAWPNASRPQNFSHKKRNRERISGAGKSYGFHLPLSHSLSHLFPPSKKKLA